MPHLRLSVSRLAIQNDYANALFLLGLSYAKLDRDAEALSVLKAAAALNPTDAALGTIIANKSVLAEIRSRASAPK